MNDAAPPTQEPVMPDHPNAKTPLSRQIESLQQIIENMATQHVTFGVKGSRKVLHPDWCPLCRLEKAEQIGSPKVIAAWVEQTVIPMLGVKMNLPEKSVERGAVQSGCSAGDLIAAIRESEVLLGASHA